jgi:6-phosphofructo-2-kinase/fructose-2,6-biphosphatase 2
VCVRPYSTANSSTSSLASQSTAGGGSGTPNNQGQGGVRNERHGSTTSHHSHLKEGIENKEISFGMSAGSTIEKPDYSEAKIVVAMVGLPARGKSYLSNKLQRYLLVRLSLSIAS